MLVIDSDGNAPASKKAKVLENEEELVKLLRSKANFLVSEKDLRICFKCPVIIVNLVLAFLIPVRNQPPSPGKVAFGFLSFMAGIFPERKGIFRKCKPGDIESLLY
ncbi:hypothetical protein MSMTP_1700 [Methanosarcina sp. MTP4]|uniref:hypothetical protein n=1 Tax=Methanosarcina sp. MTP4 TaxID=1434100 RepID=UPI00061619ED|nr:hypothetical protein [Methanosarcina sp. MTP4]AKB25169.1 hypothetical protein MSMTP_1700 [Methanosarcina sp. MTP4]